MLNKMLLRFITLSFFICLFHCCDSTNSNKDHLEFSFYMVGSGGVKARFGTDIFQALDSLRDNTDQLDEFLFTIAEEPLTMNQIQKRSGLTQSQVEYFVTSLGSCNLIKKFDQNRWTMTLPVVTDNQMKIIRKDLAPMANSVAQYLKKEIYKIWTLYEKVKSPQDPSWEDITHLIISKFIIDGTFHSYLNMLNRENDDIELNNQNMNVIPAFFLQNGGNNSNFGCNWYKFEDGDDQREVYVLHGAILDRYRIAMNKYRGDQHFSECLFNISPEGKIHSLTDQEKEMLKEIHWISNDSLLVPIVNASTIKSLWPAMENLGRAAAEVAFAKFEDLTDSYNRSPYSEFLDNEEDYIQVLIHSLFSLTIEHLEKSGTVSKIPKPVPESFGVFIVTGGLF